MTDSELNHAAANNIRRAIISEQRQRKVTISEFVATPIYTTPSEAQVLEALRHASFRDEKYIVYYSSPARYEINIPAGIMGQSFTARGISPVHAVVSAYVLTGKFPKLRGTDLQIKVATRIRASYIDDDLLTRCYVDTLKNDRDLMFINSEAAYWIHKGIEEGRY